MNNFKYLSITALSLIISACTTLQQTKVESLSSQAIGVHKPQIEAASKAAKGKMNLQGWEIKVTGIKYAGQKIEGKYRTHEAAEVWTVVSVTLKNTTEKIKREDDAWIYIISSKLVDSKSNKYDIKDRGIKYDINLLGKPFVPGETRAVDLLFDTPKGIKADKLIITNEKLEDIALKL